MNGYDEIVLFIWLILLTIGFSFTLIDMIDRTKKLKDTVDNLDAYINVSIDPQFKSIRQLVIDEIINKYRYREDKKIGVGKWVRFESDGTYGSSYWYGCSICHNEVPKSQQYHIDYFSPYCPACGAKMELESEVGT